MRAADGTLFRLPSRGAFVAWTILLAVVVAYGSTALTVVGFNYTPADPVRMALEFSQRLRVWVPNGSDQRADWMGNLTMMVPMGFLLAGCFAPRDRRFGAFAAAGAFVVAVVFILAVKYAQLFFPPRTVTLNYVVAQAAGAVVGIAVFPAWQAQLAWLRARQARGLDGLALLLRLYTIALFVFMLMPLDFALDAPDLAAQIRRLPDVLTAVTGEGRSPLIRTMVIVASVIALMPVGMLATLRRFDRYVIERSVAHATLVGFAWILPVFLASLLVMGANPSLSGLAGRVLGIALGAALMRWLARQDMVRLRWKLSRLVPWLVLPYLALLLAANGLVSTDWVGPDEAWAAVKPRGLMPLYNYYIVGKAEAARNIVAHAVMYAPIGIMAWLARGGGLTAGLLAALLAAAVETARWFRPGLEGEVNTIAVAAGAAWLAAGLMPMLWWMLTAIGPTRAAAEPRGARAEAGEVEYY